MRKGNGSAGAQWVLMHSDNSMQSVFTFFNGSEVISDQYICISNGKQGYMMR